MAAAIIFLAVFMGGYFLRKKDVPYQRNEGIVFGTVYHMIYQYAEDLQPEIEAELKRFDLSLSPFNKESVITRVNRNDTDMVTDPWFITVYNKSVEIHRETQGAFDPTVSPLINAWGFGFEKKEEVPAEKVDSLLRLVGIDKTRWEDNRIVKSDSRITFNFSAIAKGYASDVIGEWLREKGINNYMVEIGGEVVAYGTNPSGNCWLIGINKPLEDSTASVAGIQETVALCNAAMATSGNYRNFYYKDGKRYAHTIDPRTGYPVQHSLLSATVLAEDCMTADAFATAFMVLGLDESIKLAESRGDIEALFIYTGEDGSEKVATTSGIERFSRPVEKEKLSDKDQNSVQ